LLELSRISFHYFPFFNWLNITQFISW